MRYIIVIHKHFGSSSESWRVIDSKANSREQADEQAYALRGKEEHMFSHVDFKVVEIANEEYLPPSRMEGARRVTFLDWLFNTKAVFKRTD